MINLSTLEGLFFVGNQLTGCVPDGLRNVATNDLSELGLPFCEDEEEQSVCVSGGAVADAANMGLVSDCEALLASRDTLAGTGTLNWSANTPITEWDGIRGRGGRYPALEGTPTRVARLYLHGRGLNGTIPAELGEVSELKWLYLHRNGLTGEVPAALNGLTKLQWLYLYDNKLSGISLKSSAPAMTGLRQAVRAPECADRGDTVRAWEHPEPGLVDAVPEPVDGWDPSRAWELDEAEAAVCLHENGLAGAIPEELAGMSSLTHLLLHRNELTGPIPPELGGLANLEWLSVYGNELDGAIPAGLGSLSNLDRLYLHGNGLTGSIPAELGDLASLTNLWLNGNELSGAIPAELDRLSNLVRWRLAGNDFTGCVPAGVAAVSDSDLDELGLDSCE